MARTWGWHCGWEAGFPRRIWPVAGLPAAPRALGFTGPAYGQDLWDVVSPDNAMPGTGARTGKYYAILSTLGFALATNFTGQWVTRTNGWVFWHTAIRLNGWTILPAANDSYVYARCSNVWAGGGNNYFGIGFKTAAFATVTVHMAVHEFTGLGALAFRDVLLNPAPLAPGPNWIVATVAHEVATKNTYLYVNGALVAGPYVPAAAVQNDMPMLPDNRFIASGGGKVGDAGPVLDADDWGGAEGSVQADVPGADMGVLLAQPNADVLTQWTPVGYPEHYRNWDAENQDVACWGCHYNDPTGIGQQEACDFAPLALAAPPPTRVEAARFVWAQGGSIHAVRGQIGAGGWSGALPAGTGAMSTAGVAPCFDGTAQWRGAQMDVMPGIGGPWTMANFNLLQGRLDAAIAVNGGVEEFYAMAMVNAAARPMPTPNSCPVIGLRRPRGAVI